MEDNSESCNFDLLKDKEPLEGRVFISKDLLNKGLIIVKPKAYYAWPFHNRHQKAHLGIT